MEGYRPPVHFQDIVLAMPLLARDRLITNVTLLDV